MGFEYNAYDQCVMNKIINGKQCTIVWHVDDLKVSHVDSKVVTSILKSMADKYGELTITRGKKHTYVCMDLSFGDNKDVSISMKEYIMEAIEEIGIEIKGKVMSPAAEFLFVVNEESDKLEKERAELFHRIVAKLLFVSTRGRPDIQLTISYLCTRTMKSDEDDWNKLIRLLRYLNCTKDLVLTLSADGANIIKWWVDASYAVHDNMRSHTGACMSLGRGMIYNKATKQKLNTKSSTEAELVGVSDIGSQMFWTLYFLQTQGYNMNNMLNQDNQSAMLLETNGRTLSGSNTQHINIRYFFIKDRFEKGEVTIVYCPTELMIADFHTKPLQRSKFIEFRDQILGITAIIDHHKG